MLKTFTLKNGLKVATYSIPQMKSVFISESVKAGSIFDTKQTSGTAHYMEHILFEGTPSFPNVEVLSDFVESLAGSFNAFTSVQSIRFYINGPANHLEDLIKISSEVFFEPLFPETGIERERGAILEEIKRKMDTPDYKRSQFFYSVRYKKGHPLLLDGVGELGTVVKITKKDIVEFWSKFFYPKNTYLTVVGGFDPAKIKLLLEKYFGHIISPKNFPGFPKLTNKDMSGRTVAIRQDQELNVCYVDLNFPTICDDEPLEKHVPQGLATSIFGRMQASRLFRLLRLQKGLVYSVGMYSSSLQHFAFADIFTQVAADKLEEVISLIIQELSSFIKNGPSEEEIKFAKNYGVNRVLMQFDHPGNIASWIESELMWENKIYTPEEYAKMIESVTKKDIMDFMKKYWDFKKLNLIIQGPIENSKDNLQKYTKMLEVL